jgi:hypothetical protein
VFLGRNLRGPKGSSGMRAERTHTSTHARKQATKGGSKGGGIPSDVQDWQALSMIDLTEGAAQSPSRHAAGVCAVLWQCGKGTLEQLPTVGGL